jgi:hypothetical protein
MADVRIEFSPDAIRAISDPARNPQLAALLDRVAGTIVRSVKAEAPVSPVWTGHSGHLRSSVHAFRQGDGSILIGPTASYSGYVIRGTRPHPIDSHGPWPLRNRRTGQVFGRHVDHPGTRPNDFLTRGLHRAQAELRGTGL